MRSLKRFAVYIISFIVLLVIIGTFTTFWKSIDKFIYSTFYLTKSENIDLRKDILLIDLPHNAKGAKSFDRGNYRKRLANLLDTIGANYDNHHHAEAVLLDIYFSNDEAGLEALKTSLKRLKDKGLKVYAVYNMLGYKNASFETHDASQAKVLYNDYLEGNRLHTLFHEGMGFISYRSELKYPSERGFVLVEALVSKVARDLGEATSSGEFILPLGNVANIEGQTYRFTHEAESTSEGVFDRGFDMKDKILIVGSLSVDQVKLKDNTKKTGTHLVAWALNDQLEGHDLAKQPLQNPILIIGMILFFSLFVVIVYALLFKYVKSLQTKPITIAILSFIISTSFLILTGFAVLALDKVIPVGLVTVGMGLAAFLSYRFAYKFLVTGVAEGSQKYDVFISYSHGNSDWVVKNVYEPLQAFRKPNGDKLNIFFDKDSIGIGEAFTVKYMWSIVDSRFFIPIFSEEYYNKNHCRNEMDLAYKRSVEKLLNIIPIAFSYDAVPEIYNHINFSDVSVNPGFIEGVKAEISRADTA